MRGGKKCFPHRERFHMIPYDDKVLGRESTISPGGPDPEKTDRVMLRRKRISRILFNNKLFDYPVSFKLSAIRNIGFGTTISVGYEFFESSPSKEIRKIIGRFLYQSIWEKLYSMF